MILKNTNAMVYVRSDIKSGDDITQLEMAVEGKHHVVGEKRYIVYEEAKGDESFSGTTTLKIEPDGVWVKRTGEINTNMHYQVGKSNSIVYKFEFGQIVMENYTEYIKYEFDETGGFIEMKYTMEMGGNKTENIINVRVKEK